MPRRASISLSVLCGLSLCQFLMPASRSLPADEPPESNAQAVTQSIKLFNGRDLAGFRSYLKDSGRDDPQQVFSVVDGAIRISGEGAGYLATGRAYRDYLLTLEYRWGQKTDGSGFVRNSGVLVHQTNLDRIWPTSIEVQLAQGCEGDLIVIPGIPGQNAEGKSRAATLTSNTRLAEDKKTRWDPDGRPTKHSGKQFWWSKHEPGFAEKLDTRGRDDVASPLGKWTRVEILARGARLTVRINGVTVNEAYDVTPAAGRILLQNEGNEVFFRDVRLEPLP